tara:strand:+ start:871 stop:1008 length:138 start_codon:yes stop_codon:yes gene_type:complete
MKHEIVNLQSDFFTNWSREFLRYLDAKENPDFPNKTRRRIWGIED